MLGYFDINFQDGNFSLRGDFFQRGRGRHCQDIYSFFNRGSFDDYTYMSKGHHRHHSNPFDANYAGYNYNITDNSDLGRLFNNGGNYDELSGFNTRSSSDCRDNYYNAPYQGYYEPEYDYIPDCGCNERIIEENSSDCGCEDNSVENETTTTENINPDNAIEEETILPQDANNNSADNIVNDNVSNFDADVENYSEDSNNIENENSLNNELSYRNGMYQYPYFDNSDLAAIFNTGGVRRGLDNSDLAAIFNPFNSNTSYNAEQASGADPYVNNGDASGASKNIKLKLANGKILNVKVDNRYKERANDFNLSKLGSPFSNNNTYYQAVANLEQGAAGYKSVNQYGYLGKYQFGKDALVDVGFMTKHEVIENGKRKTKYSWAGKMGIRKTSDFLNSPKAQETAMGLFTQQNNKALKEAGAYNYVGKTIRGIKITQAGLLAARHLGGLDGVMAFLLTNGKYIRHDANGTPITKYLHKLSNIQKFS